jgi:hypothetical protein
VHILEIERAAQKHRAGRVTPAHEGAFTPLVEFQVAQGRRIGRFQKRMFLTMRQKQQIAFMDRQPFGCSRFFFLDRQSQLDVTPLKA